MTDTSTKIHKVAVILNIFTGYLIGHYPENKNIGSVNSANPKGFIFPNNANSTNNNTQYSYNYNFIFDDTSYSNLETLQETLLGISSDAANGYNPSKSKTVEYYIHSHENDVTYTYSPYENESDTAENIFGKTPTALLLTKFYCQHTTDLSISTSSIKMTPSENNANTTETLTVAGGYKHHNNSINNITIPTDIHADLTGSLLIPEEDLTAWTADSEVTLSFTDGTDSLTSLLNDLIDKDTSNIDEAFLLFFNSNDILATNRKIYGLDSAGTVAQSQAIKLSVTYTTMPSSYPFWVEVRDIKIIYGDNRFYLIGEIEARWAI